jgi:myo-inositol 2-dehydrogenase/D-chiro-inositol 1-dehydrogenase
LSKQYINIFQDASVVYEDPLVDGCIIASSTFTHEAIVMGSLKGGKAVMCEKPMTETDEGTKRCYAMSKEVGRPLLCAFNKRFDPSFRNVYDRVRAGDIGRVNIVKSTSRDGQLPPLEYLKTSGGIFHDSTIHDIDMITWILG